MLSQSQEPVSYFIVDAALHLSQLVCDELKLPRLMLRTGGASSFLIFASFCLLREKGYLPVQDFPTKE
ncbi:UDP-glycosyltransferase 76F1 [Spatholobus suberectus]|nr:UDP-glycosyltransferase 76F1 [Spatholobus suberectus]